MSLDNHVRRKHGCPKCRKKILCHEESFASHKKSDCWSDKNIEKAHEVARSSHQKFYLNCDNPECMHEIFISPNTMQRGRWCGYCSNPPTKLCSNNSDAKCERCYNKSFASHPKSVYWIEEDNEILPCEIFKSSERRCTFKCPYCNNKYESQLCAITQNGTWCRCTKNKTENKLFKFLNFIFGKNKIEREITIDGYKNKKPFRFDFCIEKYKIIIELDGDQHFQRAWKKDMSEVIQHTDIYKMKCANVAGYSVIRLLQDDVWKDKNDWKFKLMKAIKKYAIPTNIFFGDCYNNHKAKLNSESDVDPQLIPIVNKKKTISNYKEWKSLINASTLRTHNSELFRMRF